MAWTASAGKQVGSSSPGKDMVNFAVGFTPLRCSAQRANRRMFPKDFRQDQDRRTLGFPDSMTSVPWTRQEPLRDAISKAKVTLLEVLTTNESRYPSKKSLNHFSPKSLNEGSSQTTVKAQLNAFAIKRVNAT